MDDISKYLIPLDELDMSLLLLDNVCLKTGQKIIRKTNYIDKRYSESGVDKDTDMFADVGLTKRCSICEIEVPKEYMKNHIESDKHKMYLNITNTAINRCKKQIKVINFNPYKYEESSFFCETCVTVISIGDKSEHLKTESHQNAVKKDLKMKKLIDFYNNISDENPVFQNHEINETKSKEEINTIVPKTFDNIIAIKGEHLVIKIDNYLIKMLTDSYNGIMLTAKHRYKCIFCNDTFKKKTKHINLQKHVKKITPIQDINCIRNIHQAISMLISN
ncbi:PREDICTED: uncharacterized protein LOC106103065 isoform X7 [Papilio polytes]|uniref:uncharacterized protein LOC106103065 isoform X7 n=1 Tax=Papilio polytes TaxID=76194 RepID=UPI000675C9B3|nr:PREDICTED: uncharacterized protein LOC106103065 isoform X7 [Papilio polytes]